MDDAIESKFPQGEVDENMVNKLRLMKPTKYSSHIWDGSEDC
jgi:hypothetical protein